MSRDLPIQVIRAMHTAETTAQMNWLLRVEGLSTTLRFVNDTVSLVGPSEPGLGDQTYTPYPFEVTLPAQTGDEAPRLEVSVRDVALHVTSRVLSEVENLEADIFAVQRGVFEDGSTTRHLAIASYEGFVVREAVGNEEEVNFVLTMEHFFDEPVGIWAMDADVAPWLY